MFFGKKIIISTSSRTKVRIHLVGYNAHPLIGCQSWPMRVEEDKKISAFEGHNFLKDCISFCSNDHYILL